MYREGQKALSNFSRMSKIELPISIFRFWEPSTNQRIPGFELNGPCSPPKKYINEYEIHLPARCRVLMKRRVVPRVLVPSHSCCVFSTKLYTIMLTITTTFNKSHTARLTKIVYCFLRSVLYLWMKKYNLLLSPRKNQLFPTIFLNYLTDFLPDPPFFMTTQ